MSKGRSSLLLRPLFLIPADLFGNQETDRSNVCHQVHLQVLDQLLTDCAVMIIDGKNVLRYWGFSLQ